MYKAQHKLDDVYILQAKAYLKHDAPLANRTVCLTTDTMKNSAVSWLGSEQAGIAYYFSASTQIVSVFSDNASETINCYF